MAQSSETPVTVKDGRHVAADVVDRAQQLFFADDRVKRRLDRLALLAERISDSSSDLAAENALYAELESATDGVIGWSELEDAVESYADGWIAGRPVPEMVGPFMPWPSTPQPAARCRGESEDTVRLAVAAWLERLDGATPGEADDLSAGRHIPTSLAKDPAGVVRKARQRLRDRRHCLGLVPPRA